MRLNFMTEAYKTTDPMTLYLSKRRPACATVNDLKEADRILCVLSLMFINQIYYDNC